MDLQKNTCTRGCVSKGGGGAAVPGGGRRTPGANITVPTCRTTLPPAALEPALDLLGGAHQPFGRGSPPSKERADAISSPTN